jgi:peptidyl-prolyl cis-trans isomerase C
MRVHCVLIAALVVSCGHDEGRAARTEDRNAVLGGDVAARVGAQAIPLSVVASVAEAQKVTAREAVRKIIDDEIAASAARARGHDQRSSWRLISTRARFTADRLSEEARRQGPPTDEEIEALSAKHWAVVDRPPSVRVIHAIVLRPKDPALLGSARALAGDLHTALAQATEGEFENKAKSVQHNPKLEVKVERLPAFTEDGWVTEGGGRMDPVFSKAAFALSTVGATSNVIETPFGLHVISLLERIPEKRMPMENRRLAFAEDVYVLRARDLMNVRLKALRGGTPIAVSPSAEQLMRAATISPDAVGAP